MRKNTEISRFEIESYFYCHWLSYCYIQFELSGTDVLFLLFGDDDGMISALTQDSAW